MSADAITRVDLRIEDPDLCRCGCQDPGAHPPCTWCETPEGCGDCGLPLDYDGEEGDLCGVCAAGVLLSSALGELRAARARMGAQKVATPGCTVPATGYVQGATQEDSMLTMTPVMDCGDCYTLVTSEDTDRVAVVGHHVPYWGVMIGTYEGAPEDAQTADIAFDPRTPERDNADICNTWDDAMDVARAWVQRGVWVG